MAPLEGVNGKTYRNCFYDHFPGLSSALTPFLPIPDSIERVPARSLKSVSSPGNSIVPEIPQLLVSEADSFLKGAKALEKKGYSELNWNLGCPSRGVVRKGKGSGLLPRTDHILRVLDEILPATSLNISLKLRLGLNSSEEIFALIEKLSIYPLKGIIIHPRLGVQKYEGEVDLSGFEKAMTLYGRKICYNGDICFLDDFLYLQKRFPDVDEWMLGRGLIADPFLLKRILGMKEISSFSDSYCWSHPLAHQKYYDFLDDLICRLKKDFRKDLSLWSYIKGLLFYTFSLPYTPEEIRDDLKKMKNEKDWNLLRSKLNRLYSIQ